MLPCDPGFLMPEILMIFQLGHPYQGRQILCVRKTGNFQEITRSMSEMVRYDAMQNEMFSLR